MLQHKYQEAYNWLSAVESMT